MGFTDDPASLRLPAAFLVKLKPAARLLFLSEAETITDSAENTGALKNSANKIGVNTIFIILHMHIWPHSLSEIMLKKSGLLMRTTYDYTALNYKAKNVP